MATIPDSKRREMKEIQNDQKTLSVLTKKRNSIELLTYYPFCEPL